MGSVNTGAGRIVRGSGYVKLVDFISLIFKEKDGAEGGTRTRMDFSTRPSNVRVYQFHHFGRVRILL